MPSQHDVMNGVYDESDRTLRIKLVTDLTGGVPGTPFNQYGEDNAVVSTVDTILTTYVVPPGKTAYISGVLVTGSATGRYKLKVNGTVMGMTRTSAASRAETMTFGTGPIACSAGDTVTVTAYHEEIANQSMEANIFGYLN